MINAWAGLTAYREISRRHIRPDNGAEIVVKETDAADFVVTCRMHNTESRRFATEQQAMKAAYRSETWCSGCAPMAELSAKSRARA